jgi:glycosyltransferase involved in cell wall biosynthesis
VVCVSEAERARGESKRIATRYRVVLNGVDVRSFKVATASDRVEARQLLGYGDEPLAVCVGRLSRQKGQDILLDGWDAVLAAVPTARLALVGEGPEADRLAARGATAVDLVGYSDDVQAWLAAADVVVVPSRWEGMALVPLEALARGRSVVATDVAGIRESVPAGCGAVVPVEDPVRLGAALAGRLADRALSDAEGQTGRRHVEAYHDSAVTNERLRSVYVELLS